MRILVDVYDPTGSTRLGAGPVLTCTSATVRRRLDGAGSLNLSGSLTDPRAGDLLQPERQVRVWIDAPEGMRDFARGIILEVRRNINARTFELSIDCADVLDALVRRTVRNGRQYVNQTISSIATNLMTLVPGWTASVESGIAANLHSARFTGTNVLKALLRLAEERGYHLRSGAAANTVEIGAFGTDSGLTFTNLQGAGQGILGNTDLVLIESLDVAESSRTVGNWISGYGAGEGQAALTLKNSTRTTPYTINTVTDDGRTLYYLQDAASIAAFGQKEKVVVFKNIAPVTNTATAKEAAANALYDAMTAWLQRNKDTITSYRVRGVKIDRTIRPGDKIRLWYQGMVQRDGVDYTYLDVNDLFWVLEVSETADANGVAVELVISTVDQMQADAAEVVVGAIEDIQTQSVSIQTFPYWTENTWTEPVSQDGTNNAIATFKIEFDDAVTDIVRVVIRFKTFPLYVLSTFDTAFRASGAAFSHAYSVLRSTHHPKGLTLTINGVNVSSSFGGPWNNSPSANTALNVECDITDLILANGLYNDHEIRFEATTTGSGTNYVQGFTGTFDPGATSSGFVQLNVRVLGVAQAILPS